MPRLSYRFDLVFTIVRETIATAAPTKREADIRFSIRQRKLNENIKPQLRSFLRPSVTLPVRLVTHQFDLSTRLSVDQSSSVSFPNSLSHCLPVD